MPKQKVAQVRLTLNGIGSFGIAALGLTIGLPGIIGLLSGSRHLGNDPDGGDKVLAIQIFCVVLGTIALISLFRTVKAWRENQITEGYRGSRGAT